jgi:D-serine dehydratase
MAPSMLQQNMTENLLDSVQKMAPAMLWQNISGNLHNSLQTNRCGTSAATAATGLAGSRTSSL